MKRTIAGAVVAAMTFALPTAALAEGGGRVTILYDAFGPPSELEKDWGFAALVEYGGKTVLFDTGNDAHIFSYNVRTRGVDLESLDAVILSHRHGDHTTGLQRVIDAHPAVPIYVPQEGALFKGRVPEAFFEREPGLPTEMQYYEGKTPPHSYAGTPWERGQFRAVTRTTEIFPGFFVLTTRSAKPGTVEMNEVSLAVRTPKGLAVVVGCSHPGVEVILAEAAKIDARLYIVTGGFHLLRTPRPEVERVATLLRDQLAIDRVAPGHCTGEVAFAVFRQRFQDHFDPAGLGRVLTLP